MAKDSKGITVKKSDNFSEWYSQVIQKAELADLRYNVKGFLVFQPWSVLAMEKMYAHFEKVLQKKGHKPYFFPAVIPESNLTKESSHLEGFTPEVFWVTEAGNSKLDERLALRPTSETAFYKMFSLWIRSYNDLPFKTYQRANIFRYDTKATRPFLRSREFYWIETHCAFASEDDAMNQVKEDMRTTKEVMHDIFGLPFIFFERPSWDKFPGANRTFAADVLNPDGKVVQQPSTHMISQTFSKAFDVKFKDKGGNEGYAFMTCYGPAISRIFASLIIIHGDDKGLRFPWAIAPLHVAIVPVNPDKKVIKKAELLKKKIEKIASVEIDSSQKTPGEKFNYWELKGVPVRIDIGLKDISKGNVTVFRRDINKKEVIGEKGLLLYLQKVEKESGNNLLKQADAVFKRMIKDAKTANELKDYLNQGFMVRCNFCSVDKAGVKCAGVVETEAGAEVRGTMLDQEKTFGPCIICRNPAAKVVYAAKSY